MMFFLRNIGSKLNKRRVMKILSFSGLGYFQSGLSFIASILLARYLQPEFFGYYSYGIVIANTLLVFMQYGMDKTLVRDLIHNEEPNLTMSSAGLIWFTIGIVGIVISVFWLVFFESYTIIIVVLISVVILSGFLRGMSPVSWFDYKSKQYEHALILTYDRVIFILIVVLGILVLNDLDFIWRLVYISIGLILSRVLSSFLEWKFVFKSSDFVVDYTRKETSLLLKNNVMIWLAALGGLLMSQLNQIILGNKSGVIELGSFALSFQIIMLFRLLQKQVLRTIMPNIAKITKPPYDPVNVKRKLVKYSVIVFVISIAMILPVRFILPFIIDVFLGDKYIDVIPISNVLFIWSVFYGVGLLNNQFLISIRLEKTFFIVTTFFGVASIFIAMYFIELYGGVGAALSLLISHSLSILVQYYIVFRKISNEKNSTGIKNSI